MYVRIIDEFQCDFLSVQVYNSKLLADNQFIILKQNTYNIFLEI